MTQILCRRFLPAGLLLSVVLGVTPTASLLAQDAGAPDEAPGPTGLSAQEAEQGAFIVPLSDNRREVVIIPKPDKLRSMNWSAQDFKDRTLDRLRALEAQGIEDPTKIAFDSSFFGLAIEETISLTSIASVMVQDLTFVPAAEIAPLGQKLISSDRNAAADALETVQALRGRAKELVPTLTAALKVGNDPNQVHYIRSALTAIGPYAAEAVPVLVEKLKASENDKHGYVTALAAIGEPAMPALKELLTSHSSADRQEAGRGFVAMGPAGEAVARDTLKSKDPQVRRDALVALAGGRTQETADAIMPLLDDADPATRLGAIRALAGQGRRGAAAVPKLLQYLKSEDVATKSAAIDALGGIHVQADTVVPALIEFIGAAPASQPTPGVAVTAVDESLCVRALVALRRFGPDAAPAAERVAGALNRSSEARSAALAVIENLGPAGLPALSPLLKMMDSPDKTQAAIAYRATGNMGPAAAAAVPKLVAALDTPAAAQAASALGGIGAGARKVLPKMVTRVGKEGMPPAPAELATALAAIDADAALTALQTAVKRPAPGPGQKVSKYEGSRDPRQPAIEAIKAIKSKANQLRAAAPGSPAIGISATASGGGGGSGGGETHFGQERRAQGFVRSARVLRKGDNLERVIALMGMPESAGGGKLVYRDQNEDGTWFQIHIGVEAGKVGDVTSASP